MNTQEMTTESFEQIAVETLSWLKGGLEQGADFVQEQAPLFAWEIVAYGRAYHTVLVAIGILLLLISCVVTKKWATSWFSKVAEATDEIMSCMVILFSVGLPASLGAAAIGCNADAFFKSWFAPRLYILEYLTDVVRGVM